MSVSQKLQGRELRLAQIQRYDGIEHDKLADLSMLWSLAVRSAIPSFQATLHLKHSIDLVCVVTTSAKRINPVRLPSILPSLDV